MKNKKRQVLSYKSVLKFLIQRLENENQIFDCSTEKSVINYYVDYFGSNPIEDYKNREIVKKETAVKLNKLKKTKFIYPNYKHPKWKSKRLEVFKRDNFTCRGCDSKMNLHCHHSFYENGRNIWDYPLDSLITLCESCHNEFHDNIKGKELGKR